MGCGVQAENGVALVALRTVAHGHMIVDSAQRRRRADAVTGVDALVLLACPVARTFGVRDTLGPAAAVRVPIEVGQARADGQTVMLATVSVRPAYTLVADVLDWCRSR